MLNEITSILQAWGQPHLASGLETLSLTKQQAFLAQLTRFSPQLLQEQRKVARSPDAAQIDPVREFDLPSSAAKLKGRELLSQGKVATLVLSGGMGSRLGSNLPKALVPVTQVHQKTLVQLLCEKTAAASKAYNTSLQIGIMTSPLNHAAIAGYLTDNRYFGLEADQVHLFTQDLAPFLDDDGNWILDGPGALATGPDGNGHALRKLIQSGIGNRWQQQGIELVTVVPIENPLADPFDAALCGHLALSQKDVVIKAIERKDAAEKVGVIVRREGRIAVQEYSELPPTFEAPLAHIGLFCFTLSFIEHIASVELPWHLARKKYGEKMIWKFERFLFDALTQTDKCGILVYPREKVYAPLKTLDNLPAVQKALAGSE